MSLAQRLACTLLVLSAPCFAQESKKPVKEAPGKVLDAASGPSEDAVATSEDRYKSFETFARAMFYLETMYVDPSKVKSEEMVTNALRGVVDHLDPHTMLMPRKVRHRKQQRSRLRGNATGGTRLAFRTSGQRAK